MQHASNYDIREKKLNKEQIVALGIIITEKSYIKISYEKKYLTDFLMVHVVI